MFHKPNPDNLKPCRHMQTLVSAWVDGKLSGLTLWYTKKHVQGCPQCRSSLPFLQTLHFRLSELGKAPAAHKLSDTQWQAVEAAWTRSEAQAAEAKKEPGHERQG